MGDDVYKADPDIIVVGCCGFDLKRNVRDTLAKRKKLQKLRAGQNHRIYASYGDWYIAQPAPFLLQGVALLAQCAYQNEPRVLDAIASLGYETVGWEAVDVMTNHTMALPNGEKESITPLKVGISTIADMEDLVLDNKVAKIQQPSILYQQEIKNTSQPSNFFSISNNKDIKVLFFSGGKDCFLALRALVRSYYQNGPFGLILMTTFDAATRVIAHQEVGIDQVIKQASHLD